MSETGHTREEFGACVFNVRAGALPLPELVVQVSHQGCVLCVCAVYRVWGFECHFDACFPVAVLWQKGVYMFFYLLYPFFVSSCCLLVRPLLCFISLIYRILPSNTISSTFFLLDTCFNPIPKPSSHVSWSQICLLNSIAVFEKVRSYQ